VTLSTAPEKAVGRALTDEAGSFSLRAPAGVSLLLSIKRIGIKPLRPQPITLSDGERRVVHFEVDDLIVSLNRVTVSVPDVCGASAANATSLARLLEEVRAALIISELSEQTERVEGTVWGYHRLVDPVAGVVLSDSVFRISGKFRSPFVSISPEVLARDGYSLRLADGSVTFFAPDPHVLASEEFLNMHCFQAVSHVSDTALVGLRFKPLPRRRTTDIEGTMWIERASAELRSIEAHYTRSPIQATNVELGIRAQFARLSGGRWIVAAWSITSPILSSIVAQPVRVGPLVTQAEKTQSIKALNVDGGFVEFGDGRFSPYGSLEGKIAIEVRGGASAARRVILMGTKRVTSADSSGHFAFENVVPGQYTLFGYRVGNTPEDGAVGRTTTRIQQGIRADVRLELQAGAAGIEAICSPRRKNDDSGALLRVFLDEHGDKTRADVVFRRFFEGLSRLSVGAFRIEKFNGLGSSGGDGWYSTCSRNGGEQIELLLFDDRSIPRLQLGKTWVGEVVVREIRIPK
jgi:hypothetical protein